MIIGKSFTWAHIPRTGGDATRGLFLLASQLLRKKLIKKMDNYQIIRKHDTFDKLKIRPDQTLILNIRRLPSFIISWIIMCAGRLRTEDEKCFEGGVWPEFDYPLPVPSKRQLFDSDESYGPNFFHKHYGKSFATLPDYLLKKYMGNYFISRWFRLEYLKHDFLEFIQTFEPLSLRQIKAIQRFRYTTKQPFKYDHRVMKFFSADEIEIIYDNNPLWREIESGLYEKKVTEDA